MAFGLSEGFGLVSNPLVEMKDLFDITNAAPALAPTAVVAGGGLNNVEIVGLTIDRQNLVRNGVPFSELPGGAIFEVYYTAVLGAGNTISFKNALVENSPDGINWTVIYDQTGVLAPTSLEWPLAGVVDTGGTGGTTQRGVVSYGTSLGKAMRYVRFDITPVLSAAGVDTCAVSGIAILSGFAEVPPGVF